MEFIAQKIRPRYRCHVDLLCIMSSLCEYMEKSFPNNIIFTIPSFVEVHI